MEQLKKCAAISKLRHSVYMRGFEESSKQIRDAVAAVEKEKAKLDIESSKIMVELKEVVRKRMNLEKTLMKMKPKEEHLGKKNYSEEQATKLLLRITEKICELIKEEIKLRLLFTNAVEKGFELNMSLLKIFKKRSDYLDIGIKATTENINMLEQILAEKKN